MSVSLLKFCIKVLCTHLELNSVSITASPTLHLLFFHCFPHYHQPLSYFYQKI
jgi:hypothetical protein